MITGMVSLRSRGQALGAIQAIMVPVGEWRSKGYLVLPERNRCSGALDITMFSLLIPVVSLLPDFMQKCERKGLPDARVHITYYMYVFEDIFNFAATT